MDGYGKQGKDHNTEYCDLLMESVTVSSIAGDVIEITFDGGMVEVTEGLAEEVEVKELGSQGKQGIQGEQGEKGDPIPESQLNEAINNLAGLDWITNDW